MDASLDIAIAQSATWHAEGVLRVLDVVARERRYFDIFEAPATPEFCKFIENRIASGNPHFVALARGEVVGWCEIIRSAFAGNLHVGALNMAILPAFRERGLGLRLLSATLERARGAGFARIVLSVHADNRRAIALYERAGFVREGVMRDASLIDGQYRDHLLMAIVDRANAPKTGF